MDDSAFQSALAELSSDRVRGASELARSCLDLLARSARDVSVNSAPELAQLLERRCDLLAAARPNMAPIQNLLTEWRAVVSGLSGRTLPELRANADFEAREGVRRSNCAVEKVVAYTADFVGTGKTIITHSLSSTVLNVFEKLRDRNIRAVITESRPLNEGYILARRLCAWSIPTQLITDAQIGLFAAQADLALVGADSLLADGSLLNKTGSYLLALAAQDAGVPFCVCCESFKRRKKAMGTPELEEMDAGELGIPFLAGLTVRNVYFDLTPAALISYWIDETGIHGSGI